MTTIFASNMLRSTARASVARVRIAAPTRFSSTMHDNDPHTLETEKKRNLSKTQHTTSTPHEHAPGWNEHLASQSEAHVKADRSTGTPEGADGPNHQIHAQPPFSGKRYTTYGSFV
ncbi:hypothetical protein BT96DRAFT_614016 [Gymnopus androsaceus JB14]|uniref:Uncharacterized protein n=1 Tax=Gymnopus androsaceus JB14 TaxID=1447944 RepID=A0A6A4GHJ5_9AGAR|nr:hypothetical protein BT96DRAFT_614016 [Gymnopus androsaceus JB14]